MLPEHQIYSCLRDIGASESLAVRISASFEHYFKDLKHRTEALVAKTLSQLTAVNSIPSGWHAKVINTHVGIFQKRIETWKSDALDKVRRHLQRTRECRGTKSRKSFNPEFVPFLEKYFEYNAYPSAPDRAIMARKSMMSPRQIEVWFQNHRNRARKDGKRLRRLMSDPLPVELSIKSLAKDMPFFIIPESERSDVKDSEHDDSEDESTNECQDATQDTLHRVTFQTPAHAFPTVYPPSCGYNPFPRVNTDFRFPAATWTRLPSCNPRQRDNISIDDLSELFTTKLHFREPSSKQTQVYENSHSCWFIHRRTIPPFAPHPALIRSMSPQTLAPSSSTTIHSPKPATSIDMRHKHKRKVAPLPTRNPRYKSLPYRNASPSESPVSPTPTHYETPPEFYVSPSPSRCSSSSSMSSIEVSTPPPSTPPPLPPSDFDCGKSLDPLTGCFGSPGIPGISFGSRLWLRA